MTRASHHLSHFHGGLALAGKKAMSTETPIASLPIAKQLVVPVHQHIGENGDLLVSVGDYVLKGQALTQPSTYVSAPVHAPSSGTIIDISEHPVPHPSNLSALCIVIETDGKDQWTTLKPVDDYRQLSAGELRNIVRQAGIVGLGGAAFPTAVKLNPGPETSIDTLIINGAECEPYITCDDMLMREKADEMLSGIDIIMHIIDARQCMIAIEDNMPQAIEAVKQAISEEQSQYIDVVAVPAIYPTGGEKQLIKVLTGKEVPSHSIPATIGLVMQNVGTAAAIHRAVILGEPLISRVVSVTGDGIQQPQNIETLIGSPISDLINQAGGYKDAADKLIMGGPMMGFTLQSDTLPIVKGSNCLLVKSKQQTQADSPAMPCIRCGDCVKVCPANLLPQQLFWHASSKNFDMVQDYHLFDCIECGCCAYVCPSNIPLVQYYRFAKTEIWNQERDRQKSDHARIRHDFRQERLDKEKRERDERLRKKKEMLEKKKQANADDKQADPKKVAIQAAVDRVNAKKDKVDTASKGTDNLTEKKEIAHDDTAQSPQSSEK